MSTYEKRVNLAANQPGGPAAAAVERHATEPARAFTNRYEIKYLLGPDRLADVRASLSEYLVSDANGAEDGGYYVHSIYFDSPDLVFLQEKFEGQLTRVKPRIRAYRPSPDGAPTALYLELKGRHDRIVEKRRCTIDRLLTDVLLTQSPVHPNGWAAKHPVLAEFQYMSQRLRLIPTVSVLYHRTAFFGAHWANLRVTFDRLVLCSPGTGLNAPSGDFMQVLPFGHTVMELKYNNKIPICLARRINSLGLQQRTFSKYAASVERCYRGLNRNYSLH